MRVENIPSYRFGERVSYHLSRRYVLEGDFLTTNNVSQKMVCGLNMFRLPVVLGVLDIKQGSQAITEDSDWLSSRLNNTKMLQESPEPYNFLNSCRTGYIFSFHGR
ncbi:hypothetical protein Dimus_038206 [Dionaea muscipula]